MSFILNIDTSTAICSVCLAENGKVLAERSDRNGNMHATMLTRLIAQVLEAAQRSYADLAAVAVSDGPGSYTGLRIGASLAKGLCYGLDMPLIAIPTLQAMAHQMALIQPDPTAYYIGMIDARRDDVYLAVYDAANKQIEPDTCVTVTDELLHDKNHTYKNLKFGGNGAFKTKRPDSLNFGTIIENIECEARNMAQLSYSSYLRNEFADVTYYEPSYLKEFTGRIKSN
jgi:tRNA threonylcarbamoyladenosine biosynthesis protein TsaB